MKKFFLCAMAVGFAVVSYAADYKHSVGLVAGSLNGISYKYFVTDNFAIQNDLVFGVQASAGSGTVKYSSQHGSGKESLDLKHVTFSTFEFVYNPNALYHLSVADGLNLVVGGGLSIGAATPYKVTDHEGDEKETYLGYLRTETGNLAYGGKFGINAFAGLEYQVPNAPVVFGFDFRPGYGLLFKTNTYEAEDYKVTQCLNMFDWRTSISMRYCF